jgi:hypothetical protein
MATGLSRLFLFLLLVCDWAGDPYFGQSPLSRPGTSQDCYCYSLACRHALRLAVVPSGVDNHVACELIDCFFSPDHPEASLLPSDHSPSAFLELCCSTPLRC